MKDTNLGTADNPILITPDNIVEVFADIMQDMNELEQEVYQPESKHENI